MTITSGGLLPFGVKHPVVDMPRQVPPLDMVAPERGSGPGHACMTTRIGTRPTQLLPGLFLAAILLIPLVAGEEIAWRAYLQGPLIRELGKIGGIVLLGLVWGIWHAPIALRGHNLRTMFWAEAFVLYPVMCVAYSFPMAFLTIETGSIWPALVFHGVNNAVGSVDGSVLEQRDTARQVEILLAVGAVLSVLFAVLLLDQPRAVASTQRGPRSSSSRRGATRPRHHSRAASTS